MTQMQSVEPDTAPAPALTLRARVEQGLTARYGIPLPVEVAVRFEIELAIIDSGPLASYFDIAAKMIDMAPAAPQAPPVVEITDPLLDLMARAAMARHYGADQWDVMPANRGWWRTQVKPFVEVVEAQIAQRTAAPLPETDRERRRWMLDLRTSGNATSTAMSLHDFIRHLTELRNLACWAAAANHEDDTELAIGMSIGSHTLGDWRLDAYPQVNQLDLDFIHGSYDTPARWADDLPAIEPSNG